jgi:hypothetical protein
MDRPNDILMASKIRTLDLILEVDDDDDDDDGVGDGDDDDDEYYSNSAILQYGHQLIS